VIYSGHIRQIGIAFKPSSLFLYFNLMGVLYLNSIADCRKIQGSVLMDDLIDAVDNVKSKPKENGFSDIEALFLSYKVDTESFENISAMTNYIEKSKGNVDIKQMAKIFGYSVNSIERLFKKHFGLTPKIYGNMIRF